jgi:hypothetical protein
LRERSSRAIFSARVETRVELKDSGRVSIVPSRLGGVAKW